MDHEADLLGPAAISASCADDQMGDAFEPRALFRAASPTGIDLQSETTMPAFSDSYLEGQDDERLRLGRELHDSTGQLLLALRLGIAHLRLARAGENRDELLEEIEDTVRQIDAEIRTFSFVHYPAELGKNDLVVALEQFAKGFGKRTGLKVIFQACCKQAQARPGVAAALLRIAQEALTNVHRHACATSVQLSLVKHRGLVELIIKDDGCGLPAVDQPAVIGGVGLQGMRHRIERLGGSLKVWRLRKGTRVAASLPTAQFYAAKAA